MVKLRKEDTADLDVEELDSLEYSTETYDSYDGDVPPKDLVLSGYVKKMWWTRTSNNDPMLKILWVADENTGDVEEYNGCPFWENYALIGGAKFRWAPFLDNYGITLKQVKNNIDVQDKDDQNGAPINKIGSFRPGEDSDEAWCRIVTGSERYNGEFKPAIKTWLPWEADDEEDVEDEEPEDEELEDEEEEPEPEPEPAPARGRGRAATRSAPRSAPEKPATPARGTRTRAATPARETAAPRGARGARTAAAAKPAATRSAPARGRGRRGGGDDSDPPF